MFSNMHHGFKKTAEARYIPIDKQYSEDEETDISIRRPGRYQAAKKFLKIFVVGHIFLLAIGSASWYMWRHRPLNKALKETSFYCKSHSVAPFANARLTIPPLQHHY